MTQARVLVAFDFGEASLEALRQGRVLAHQVGGALGVVHVLPAIRDLAAIFPERSLDSASEEQARAEKIRAEIEAHARTHLHLELGTVFVEWGAPYAEIVRRAESWNADYLVVGSHGRSGLSRMVLGSVAERAVRHAHCSVLVARSGSKPGVVLVATDLSALSLPAIEEGVQAARRSGSKLVVMSVLEWPGIETGAWAGLFGALPVIPSEETRRQLRDAARRIIEQSISAAGGSGEVLLAEGSPPSEIISTSETLGAELLVVGTHGRTGLERLALGSVAERVIRSATCSVLAVRSRREGAKT